MVRRYALGVALAALRTPGKRGRELGEKVEYFEAYAELLGSLGAAVVLGALAAKKGEASGEVAAA